MSYVPSRSAVVALGGIVESLAMTTHEQDFVHRIKIGISIQGVHYLDETLPLGGIADTRARVCLVYEPKVDCGLDGRIRSVPIAAKKVTYVVKSRSNSVRLILKKVAGDSTVADISRSLGCVEVLGFRRPREERSSSSSQR